ncbi:MAG: BON domain-containing protein [Myxococcales bacterium]
MSDGKDSLPPGIPPDVAEMIRRARADQRAAAELKEAIGAAGIDILDLVVTYAGGVVALTGKAATQVQRDGAADVVRRQEGVRQVSNGIVVVPR